MKTLLVRPGVEIVERTFKGPWPPELDYLERLYREPGIIFRGFVTRQALSSASTLAVGTILRELGEDVEYLDIPYEFGIPLTGESVARRREKIEEFISQGRYDVVGISCTSTLEGLATKGIAEAAKRVLEDVEVVVGGYQATSEVFDFMERIPAIDVIVLSDFEPIAEQLYSSFSGKIPIHNVPNIVYRKNGKIYASERKHLKIEPEELLPFDYSLIRKYLSNYPVIAIESSRGCPFNCSFCQEKVLRKSYVAKEAHVTVNEIIAAANYIAQFVDYTFFGYCDACWGVNAKWVKDFCSELADRKDEIESGTFGWGIEARIGLFDDEELALMGKAGCMTIAYGVESLSPTMLTMMNKTRAPQKYVDSVFDSVEKTLRANIQTVLFFILGMPGETSSTIEETLMSARNFPLENRNIHMEFGLAYALPGTTLYQEIHDPQFIEKCGIKVHDEYGWEKAYLPRFTPLFDPSRELSAAELTDIFLDIIRGARGISTSLEKQLETFKDVKEILERDGISPEELAKLGGIYRKISTEV